MCQDWDGRGSGNTIISVFAVYNRLTLNPMKKYYLHDGRDQHGPFTLNELKGKSIQRDTLIWTAELADWTNAGELIELQELFTSTPPPLHKTSSIISTQYVSGSEKTGFRIGRFFGWTGLVVVILAVIGFLVYKNQHSSTDSFLSDALANTVREKTPEELRIELAQRERTNPSQYLVPTVKVRENLIGETIVEGSVMNNASIAVFKDIVLEVTYLSKTGTDLGSKSFVIYEVAAPGKWASFKFRTYSPDETKGYSARVIEATPMP